MSSKRLVIASIAAIAVVVVSAVGGVPPASTPVADALAGPTINGGGSSFAKLEIDQWRAEVARAPFNLNVNYVAQGSSFGRQQYIAGNLDFAASDIPFTAQELTALNVGSRKDFAYVPVSAGGLGIMYHLRDQSNQLVTNLNLFRRTVCRMFSEPNMRWSDPEIQQANPNLRLPDELIRPIVRSDGSGTSYVLSEYCLTVAPDVWGTFIQSRTGDSSVDPAFFEGKPISNWPQGWGIVGAQLAADGVAAAVADSSGLFSVTYNEAGFAKVRGFPNASVQNQAGIFTQPTEDAVSIALGYATGRDNGTFILDYDGPDPRAYFPSTYSYVIAQTTGFPADKGEVLARFLCYAVTRGQRVELTSRLGYARLSAPLVDIARRGIARIPGAPAWEQCKVDAPAPPPAATTVPPTTVRPGTPTTVRPGTPTTTPSGGGGGSAGPTTTVVAGGSTGGGSTGGGSTGGGSTGGGSTGGGSTGGGSTGGGSTGGGSSGGVTPIGVSTQTSISIDEATGDTIVVTLAALTADGQCVDPNTGEAVDPTLCDGLVPPVVDGGATPDGGVAAGGPVAAAPSGGAVAGGPTPPNPIVSSTDDGPGATRILWWLVQGAALCAVGVALAGARRRMS
jgi:ABC-type phosphate transport system substrate-binding protein